MTNTFREHLQRAISETFDLWDISSQWWESMTWPTKRQRQRQWQIYFENTSKERSVWLLTFETFDHSDDLANNKQWERQTQRQLWWQIHLENTLKWQLKRSTSNRNRGLSIFKACLLVYFVFCVWISHLDFQNIPNIWLYRSDSASRPDISGFQLDSNLDHFHFEQIDVLTTFRRGITIPTRQEHLASQL